ncbi:hypothetical protein RFI_11159, partial [Reticulomyxa filosa]
VLCVWDCNNYECLAVISQFSNFTSVSSFLCSEEWWNTQLRNTLMITDENGLIHQCLLKELTESNEVMSLSHETMQNTGLSQRMSRKKNQFALIKQHSLQLTNQSLMQIQYAPNVNEYISDELHHDKDGSWNFQCLVGSSDMNIYIIDHCITRTDKSNSVLVGMTCQKTLLGHNDHILDMALIPVDNEKREQIICIATNSPELRILDLQTFNASLTYGHTDTIMSVAVHLATGIIATASKDNTVRFWKKHDSLTLKCIGIGEGHTEGVNCIASCNDANHCWFVSGGVDKSIRVWEINKKLLNKSDDETSEVKCAKVVFVHESEVMSIDIAPNGLLAVSSSMDGTIAVCTERKRKKKCIYILKKKRRFNTVYVFFTYLFHFYWIWKEITTEAGSQRWLKPIKTTKHAKGRSVWCVKFSPFERLIASCHNNGEIRIWSVESYDPKRFVGSGNTELSDPLMFVSGDNTHLMQCVNVLEGNKTDGSALTLCFVNHGLQILSSHGNGLLKLWTVKTGECNGVYRQHYDRVWSILSLHQQTKSRDENGGNIENENVWFVTGGTDAILNIWRDETKENERMKMEEKHEWTSKQTQIKNYIRDNKFGKAVQLCIELDQPQRLLQLLLEIIEGKKENVIGKLEILTEIVRSLNAHQLGALITLINDWNTNSRYCTVSQFLLYVIFKNYELDDLCKLTISHLHRRGKVKSKDNEIINLDVPEVLGGNVRQQSFAEIVSALSAYSKRHYQRIDNLIKQCYLLDYVTECMSGSSITVQNNTTDENDKQLTKTQDTENSEKRIRYKVYTMKELAELKSKNIDNCKDLNLKSFLQGLEFDIAQTKEKAKNGEVLLAEANIENSKTNNKVDDNEAVENKNSRTHKNDDIKKQPKQKSLRPPKKRQRLINATQE